MSDKEKHQVDQNLPESKVDQKAVSQKKRQEFYAKRAKNNIALIKNFLASVNPEKMTIQSSITIDRMSFLIQNIFRSQNIEILADDVSTQGMYSSLRKMQSRKAKLLANPTTENILAVAKIQEFEKDLKAFIEDGVKKL